MERIIKRGDIYYAELHPVIGSEQGGTHPVLIISNNTGKPIQPYRDYCSYHEYTDQKQATYIL